MKKEYYRNIKELTSREGILIDAGALWEKKNGLLVLVDEDQYVTAVPDKNIFKEETKHK